MVTDSIPNVKFRKGDKVKCIKDVKWANSTTSQYSYSFRKDEVCEVYGINTNFGAPKLMLLKENKDGMHLTNELEHFEIIREQKNMVLTLDFRRFCHFFEEPLDSILLNMSISKHCNAAEEIRQEIYDLGLKRDIFTISVNEFNLDVEYIESILIEGR